MRALTLTQPWCGLVAAGIKRIENRDRLVMHPRYNGARFALHAGKMIDESVYRRIGEIAPELFDGWDRAVKESWPAWYRLSRITGAIIGVASVDRVVSTEVDEPPEVGGGFDPTYGMGDQQRWYFGPVGYMLTDIHVLTEPVRCAGYQWFWEVWPDLEASVAARLPMVAP